MELEFQNLWKQRTPVQLFNVDDLLQSVFIKHILSLQTIKVPKAPLEMQGTSWQAEELLNFR
jgi:hypothetical protein